VRAVGRARTDRFDAAALGLPARRSIACAAATRPRTCASSDRARRRGGPDPRRRDPERVAALVVAGIARGAREGVERAREAIASGRARRTMTTWVDLAREARVRVSGTRLDPIVADVRKRRPSGGAPNRWTTACDRPTRRVEARAVRLRLPAGRARRRRGDEAALSLRGDDRRGRARPYASLARAYREGGANAISVLTEQDHFGGSLDDLAAVAFTGCRACARTS
jgi:hypothetical protein